MVLNVILGILTVLSCGLAIWQWLVARRFPLEQRMADTSFAPPVTLLKPLKGCDVETKGCLQSWLSQNYSGRIQILFGVASPDDPVCELVRGLIAEHPNSDVQLVICAESLGANAKVSTLVQLGPLAKHDIVAVSDADVRVPQDFLVNAVQPLRNADTGLVNCFYRYANPTTLAMQWEAIAVNADFWSQVLQSRSLKPIDFALGAVMATRREQLREIGGFESLVDYLADDYQLGNRIAKTGKRIEISPVVVECWESPKTWGGVWRHQLRWARTIRVCQPLPFFFSILSNATLWPLLWFIWLTLSTRQTGWNLMLLPLLIFLPVRIAIAMNLQERLTAIFSASQLSTLKSQQVWAYFWLVPIKDLLGAVIWALSFFGNTVEWRGKRLKVNAGGRLSPLQAVH